MDARITARICGLMVALLFAATAALAAGQGRDNTKGAPQGSHRAAQDKSLDFAVDYDGLAKQNQESRKSEDSEAEKKKSEEEEPLAAPGSYRAAQEENGVPKGVDWSRRLGKNWRMDPVAMDRRQDGKQSDYNADVDDQLLGVEIRRPF